jgi:hypothetical protein
MSDDFDPLTEVRADRFRELVAELLPKIRRVSPELTDEQALAAAELMARYRIADEALGKNAL